MDAAASTKPLPEDATGPFYRIDASAVTVPREIGPIRLVREIGRGGMGAVWLGRHEFLQRDVAVKFLLTISADRDSDAVRVFLDGARAAAAVRHTGLTLIHHADVVGDVPYIVMDWVDGAPLSDLLRCGPLSIDHGMCILRRVCDTLAALHDAGIVHRDIKPSNILLDRDGNLFVTDFGLACDRMPSVGSIRVKGLAGTLGYMAPEMFDGVISPRADVYALGVMAYEMLTEQLPFGSHAEQLRKDRGPLPREPLVERGVPKEIIAMLDRLTNPNAMFRPKHARQALALVNEAHRAGRGPNLATLLTRDAVTADVDEPASAGSSSLAEIADRKRRKPPAVSNHVTLVPQRELQGDVVPATLLCLRCGEDQQGVPLDSVCRECGLPVAENLSLNRVVVAPSAYLQHIARGAKMAAWGWIGLFAGGIPFGFGALLADATGLGTLELILSIAGVIVLMGMAILFSAGCRRLTSRPPDPSAGSRLQRVLHLASTVAVYTALLAIAFLLKATGLDSVSQFIGDLPAEIIGTAAIGLVILAAMLALLICIGLMLHVRCVARDLRQPRMAARAGQLALLPLLVLAIVGAGLLARAVPSLLIVAMPFMSCSVLVLYAGPLLAAPLLRRLATALHEASTDSDTLRAAALRLHEKQQSH